MDFLLPVLRRLECRGYDSAGVALTGHASDVLSVRRAVGRLADLAAAEERSDPALIARHVLALVQLPDRLAAAQLAAFPVAQALAGELIDAPGFLFVSRGAGLPYAAEGALKLKEITYRWAESLPAGELKHGSIAFIEQCTPVIVIDSGEPLRLSGAIAEMAARGARVIRVGAVPEAAFQGAV